MADGNIIEVTFRATIDKLREGMQQAKESVAGTSAEMRTSMEAASSAMSNSNAQMSSALEGVSKKMDQVARSTRNIGREMQDLKLVEGVKAGLVKSTDDLAKAEAALDRLMKEGLLTTQDMEEAFEALNEAEMDLAVSAGKAEKAVGKQNKEIKNTGELSLTAKRQLSSIGTQAVLGQWQGMTSVMASFATTSGVVTASIAGIIAVMAGLVAVLGLVAYGFVTGQMQQAEFARALVSTGNYAGQTASSLQDLSREMVGGSVSIKDATDATLQMVAAGKLNANQFELAGLAAADFSRMTGKSMKEAVTAVTALADDPVRAVMELNKQYHFLTAEQYEYITALERTKGTAAATDEVLRILAASSKDRAQSLADDAGYVERAWNGVKRAVDAAKEAIASIGKTKTNGDQIAVLENTIAQIQRASGNTNSANPYAGMSKEAKDSMIAGLRESITALEGEEQAIRDVAQAASERAAIEQKGIAAQESIDARAVSLSKEKQQQKELNDLVRDYTELRAANPFAAALEGVQFGADGKPTGGGQFGAEAQGIKDKYTDKPNDTSRSDAAEAARAAREAATAEMNMLAIKRDATEQYSEARMQLDEQIVARAKALYGEDSGQYRSALLQMESDKRASQQRLEQLAAVKTELQMTLNEMELEEERRLAERAYNMGKLSAQQMYDIENDLVERKLDLLRKYYEGKAAIAAANGDDVGAAQARANIEIAQAEATNAMRLNEEAFQSESYSRWQSWGDTIAGTFGALAQNMIFSGMTWRDALVNVMGGLLQTFIGFTQQMLSKWIASKMAETAATVSTNAIKVASDKMAAKESIVATAGAAVKNIMAKAAEVFANVYNAIAGIPYIGPFLAPAMAVAAGAVVVGMVSRVASAEKGYERVPADGTITELHKDEQVLPAEYAEGLRKVVADGGRSGGGGMIVIQAMDAQSVKRVFRDNAGLMSEALGNNIGNFKFEG